VDLRPPLHPSSEKKLPATSPEAGLHAGTSIYLDHAATTPMLPAAIDAMLPFLGGSHANPSSPHAKGRAARRAIDDARDALADFLGCAPGELIFTSGGTEADNLAITGTAGGGVVVTSAVEHHAVLLPAEQRQARICSVDANALLDLRHLAELLDDEVSLISVMAVNNEVGTIEPLEAVVALARELAPRALLHCDAVQAAPWIDVATATAKFDMVSVSAHKFGGPTGVGALVVRDRARARLRPLLLGGAQEAELRAGTENVAGIVAAGAAATEWGRSAGVIVDRVRMLRDRLEDALLASGATANVDRSLRVASILPLHVRGVATEELLMLLDRAGVEASAGAACASGALLPSHVLTAMGIAEDEIQGSIRFSLGWSTTSEEIDGAIGVIQATVSSLVSPQSARL
jgi:cysteine desulfurase